MELLEQARPRARCRRAGGVDVDFVVISEGLWTELLLICLPCVCVCVCVMSNNEVQCGELMKFFLHWGQFAPLSGDLGG